MKKLSRLLEGWRMALLPLKSVFLWEQQWHPCAILAATSLIYIIIWFMDLNFLTSFAVVGLIINFLDFVVPITCNSLFNPNSWTGNEERAFQETCKSIVASYNRCLYTVHSFYAMRDTSPLMVSYFRC